MGVVELGQTERFVIADLPGLIEGAAEGAGLGHRFLGHAERCAAILHLVDGTDGDPAGAYNTIRKELVEYDTQFLDKPELVVLNKCDALDEDTIAAHKAELEAACGKTVHTMSGVSGMGVKKLMSELFKHVEARRKQEKELREAELKAIAREEAGLAPDDGKWRP